MVLLYLIMIIYIDIILANNDEIHYKDNNKHNNKLIVNLIPNKKSIKNGINQLI